MITLRQALLLIAAAVIIAIGIRARAAGMIVSPGAFMGINTKTGGGSAPPPSGVNITTLAGDPITALDAQNLETL